MALWKRFWLLLTVIWVIVAALNVVTILAFGEDEVPSEKILWPIFFAVAVPELLYGVGWVWARLRQKK